MLSSRWWLSVHIRVINITKTYGASVRAVESLSFFINSGESVALIGPNGAGKTTTIHIILGLLKPDEGEVYIDGVNMTDEKESSEIRSRIGFAPQNIALDFFLTVEDNIELYLKLNGLSRAKRRERTKRILELMGLYEYRNRRVETLSGGLARRVHIARALALDPELIILDEPTVGLDPVSRRLFWEALKGYIKESGATLLWSSHYLEEIERNADRVILLNRGRKLMDAPPGEIVSKFSRPVLELEIPNEEVLKSLTSRFGGNYVNGRLIIDDVDWDDLPKVIASLSKLGAEVRLLRWGSKSLEEVYLEVMS